MASVTVSEDWVCPAEQNHPLTQVSGQKPVRESAAEPEWTWKYGCDIVCGSLCISPVVENNRWLWNFCCINLNDDISCESKADSYLWWLVVLNASPVAEALFFPVPRIILTCLYFLVLTHLPWRNTTNQRFPLAHTVIGCFLPLNTQCLGQEWLSAAITCTLDETCTAAFPDFTKDRDSLEENQNSGKIFC